jgi:hypothetical protein
MEEKKSLNFTNEGSTLYLEQTELHLLRALPEQKCLALTFLDVTDSFVDPPNPIPLEYLFEEELLFKFPNLLHLAIASQNNIKTIEPIVKSGMAKKLEYLYICMDDVFEIRDEDLKSFPCLEAIYLSKGNLITNQGLKNLPKDKFKELCLFGNNLITDSGLANLPNLELLRMWYNEKITRACLKHLPKLKELDLDDKERSWKLPTEEKKSIIFSEDGTTITIEQIEVLKSLLDGNCLEVTHIILDECLTSKVFEKELLTKFPKLERIITTSQETYQVLIPIKIGKNLKHLYVDYRLRFN